MEVVSKPHRSDYYTQPVASYMLQMIVEPIMCWKKKSYMVIVSKPCQVNYRYLVFVLSIVDFTAFPKSYTAFVSKPGHDNSRHLVQLLNVKPLVYRN